jgi:hypothetical protein
VNEPTGRPLTAKLGIRPGARVAVLGAPDGFTLEGLEYRARLSRDLDVILAFLCSRAALERRLPALGRALAEDGGLWLAWPKRSSGIVTDLSDGVLREVVLPTGLVDNKVCAIDAIWSGLRFAWRRELRALAAGHDAPRVARERPGARSSTSGPRSIRCAWRVGHTGSLASGR